MNGNFHAGKNAYHADRFNPMVASPAPRGVAINDESFDAACEALLGAPPSWAC